MFSIVFFFKQKTAYEMRISDWSSDVCSSDLDKNGDIPAGFCRCRHMGSVRDIEFDGNGPARKVFGEMIGVRDFARADIDFGDSEIGRASCRERVCQYV